MLNSRLTARRVGVALALLLLTGLCAVQPFPTRAQRFDAAQDFAADRNPNGAWSYGQEARLGAAFTRYAQTDAPDANTRGWHADQSGTSTPAVHKNVGAAFNLLGDVRIAPGHLQLHPGPDGSLSVVRFIAPSSGTYSLISKFYPMTTDGTTTDVHVLVNGKPAFDGVVSGTNSVPTSAPQYEANLELAQGDTVDFAVDYGADKNYASDSTGLDAALTRVAAPQAKLPPNGLAVWNLTQDILPDCRLQSFPNPAATLPDLSAVYFKGHSYLDNEAWTATCDLKTPLDLSEATRFTCLFQAHTGNGWYSGRWTLRLTDRSGHAADFLIDKEAWRARAPRFEEQALSAFPPGFDAAHVVRAAALGNASVHEQTATVKISNLVFDAKPVGEADARRRAAWQALQARAPHAQPFFVHVLPSTDKPYRDDWQADWTRAAPATPTLHAAQGGHDDFQVAVLPSREAGSSIKIEVEPLAGPGGATIGSEQMKLYQMLWVPTLPEGRPDVYEGWYPDILKPITEASLPVNPNFLSDLWVDVQTPRNAVPGVYRGRILLRQGTTVRAIPVALTVHDFVLPERPTFRTSFWLFPTHLGAFYGIKDADLTFADYKAYARVALEHETTPVSADYVNFAVTPKPDGSYAVDAAKWKEYYQYVLTHGGNAVNLGYSHWSGSLIYIDHPARFPGERPQDAARQLVGAIPAHRQQLLKTLLAQEHAFLEQHGWDKLAYLQLYDEIAGQKNIMQTAYPVVKAVSPQTLIAQTQLPDASYAKWVDVFIPTIPLVDDPTSPRAYTNAVRAAGKHPWFYSCVSYGITIPEVGVRDRLVPLEGFNSDAEGYLYWSLNWYQTPQPDFPDKPWNGYRSASGVSPTTGDGVLIYPPAVRGGEPMPATRLKVYRDGMEDYEFLHALQGLYAEKKSRLSADQQQAVEQTLDLSGLLQAAWENPELVSERRAQAGQWIDRLVRL